MFNNFHIIQFYFQFPLLIKSYDGCYMVVVVSLASNFASKRGMLKCQKKFSCCRNIISFKYWALISFSREQFFMMDDRHLRRQIYTMALAFIYHETENNFAAISTNLSTHQSNQTLSSHSFYVLCWLMIVCCDFYNLFSHSTHKSPHYFTAI